MNSASVERSERTTRRRGAGLDLSLHGVPRGSQRATLTALVRTRIVDGSLAPGTDLPSTRQLATDLGVSRGVVVAAYEQLVAEGHLVSDRGSGTSVGQRPGDDGVTRDRIDVPAVAGLNPGQPDPSLFPRRDWLRATHRALTALPDSAFSYGDTRGHLRLRSALRTYLGRTRGIVTDEDRIIVTNGFAQCLNLLVELLTRRDGTATIAVEDPGSSGARVQLQWLGAEVVPVAVDGRGIDVAALANTGARAVIVTPAHQYPTGVTLAPERRHALMAWARATGGIVVEDDYDAEYRYDRQALTSLHALDPQHVIAGGSVSKSLGPALRLGWMVVPDHLVVDLTAAKAHADLGTSIVSQAALAEFLDSGAMDRHLRRTRAGYRRRRDALVEGLRSSEPTSAGTSAGPTDVSGIAAGLHVLLRLPDHADHAATASLVDRARTLGFEAQPLARYQVRPGPSGHVLGYASLQPPAIRTAAATLAAAIHT